MHKALTKILWRNVFEEVVVFINNLTVFASTLEEHEARLMKVLAEVRPETVFGKDICSLLWFPACGFPPWCRNRSR